MRDSPYSMRRWLGFEVGDRAFVRIESWAGRSLHAVRIRRLCPARAKVEWLEAGVRHRRGQTSYIPYAALVHETIATLKQRLAQGAR